MASIKINGDTSGSTTITAPATGSDETIELSTVLDAKAPLASPTFTGTPALPDGTTLAGSLLTSGKILQIVRATDSTLRSTTSTSYVDVTGMSVTITPQKSDSALILIAQADIVNNTGGADARARFRITDSSNNPVSGAERMELGPGGNNFHQTPLFLAGYATPATTSSVTYKLRFLTRNSSNSVLVENDQNTGQMYAIEVSA